MTKHPNLKDFLPKNKDSKPLPFIDHLLSKLDEHISKNGKILILTLTKKSSEEITNYLVSKGYKAYYLHSEIVTMDRWEILKKLKTGEIDIIVGVNLLREGIDLPEVSFLAILDADKEGFLRSSTSLIQIIGRASRNPNSEVVLYADQFTESMIKSLRETYRRRKIQDEFNKKYNITPKKATSNIKDLESVRTDQDLGQHFSAITKGKVKRLKRMTKKEKEFISKNLKKQMDLAIKEWRFEDATVIRDQIKELEEGIV
ncbi:MAG TPA: helicase-related protein [Candidatus Absconditabacterales bacterium]|nr:helicase-related protein [Candidatus Absconditabacterales bacterium]HOQ78849.1 helicase-related protein [Candidatus Absconditabacterales bacterium]